MLFTLLEYQSAIKSATQIIIGPIAQLAEHSTENASVRSSTLRWATILKTTRSSSEFFRCLGICKLLHLTIIIYRCSISFSFRSAQVLFFFFCCLRFLYHLLRNHHSRLAERTVEHGKRPAVEFPAFESDVRLHVLSPVACRTFHDYHLFAVYLFRLQPESLLFFHSS